MIDKPGGKRDVATAVTCRCGFGLRNAQVDDVYRPDLKRPALPLQ